MSAQRKPSNFEVKPIIRKKARKTTKRYSKLKPKLTEEMANIKADYYKPIKERTQEEKETQREKWRKKAQKRRQRLKILNKDKNAEEVQANKKRYPITEKLKAQKRDSARKHRKRVREDPELKAAFKVKEQERYQIRKSKGYYKYKSINEKTIHQQVRQQEFWRERKRKQRQRLKDRKGGLVDDNEDNSLLFDYENLVPKPDLLQKPETDSILSEGTEIDLNLPIEDEETLIADDLGLFSDEEVFKESPKAKRKCQANRTKGQYVSIKVLTDEEKETQRQRWRDKAKRRRERFKKLGIKLPQAQTKDKTKEDTIRRQKRDAARRHRQRIRDDPKLWEEEKRKEHDRYVSRKLKGLYKPTAYKSIKCREKAKQDKQRQVWRDKKRKQRQFRRGVSNTLQDNVQHENNLSSQTECFLSNQNVEGEDNGDWCRIWREHFLTVDF